MMNVSYTLTDGHSVVRNDGAVIPACADNTDWISYQQWLAAGNVANPAVVDTANLWRLYQAKALDALNESDVTILRCVENGVAVPAAWAQYRKSLRAIVSSASGDPSVPLVARPPYPTGT